MIPLSAPASFLGCRHRTTRKRKPDATDKRLSALPPTTNDTLGPFTFRASSTVCIDDRMVHTGLQQRERIELEELIRSNTVNAQVLAKTVVALNDESSSSTPRLRLYNWCVSNYSKAHAVVTRVGDRVVDPVVSYNAMLKRLHRTLFDPYRRGTQLFFSVEGDARMHHTTVGQLLFIKWSHECGIDKYVESHEAEIRAHLNETTRARSAMGKQRVRELTTSRCKIARIVG